MINYEKIKLGKGLTPNQKRLRAVWQNHKLNLEGPEIKMKDFLDEHKVRMIKLSYSVSCSRRVNDVFIVYDAKQKENLVVKTKPIDTQEWYWGTRYPALEDNVYICLGAKNIRAWERRKCGVYDGILNLYDNQGKFSNVYISVNHRKNASEIREIKRERRRKVYEDFMSHLRFDSVINIRRYRALTGACQMGCQDFADRHNLPYNTRMKVSDLLRILDVNDYGYNKLVNALGI